MGLFLTFLVFAFFTILGELLRPKQNFEDAKPAGLGDFQFPTATEKRKVPIVWGTVQLRGPNVVWYGDLRQVPIEETVRVSLFDKETFVKGYRYYVGIQFALCRGPIDGLRRVWIKDEVVFDGTTTPATHDTTFDITKPQLFGGDDFGTGGFVGTFRFFAGENDQSPSSYLTPFQEILGQACAFRKTAYIAPDESAPYVGNSTSLRPPRFEVVRVENANPLGLATASVNDLDANPANALYEALTDDDWGMGIPTSEVDSTSFEDAADTLATEGNGFSFVWDRAEGIENLIERLESQIDGVTYKDPSTGLYKLKLARDDYSIGSIPVIDDNSIIEVASFTQSSFEETTNVFTAGFTDRADDYKETFATAQDMANVRIQGGRLVHSSEQFPGVKDAALANALVWRDLRTLAYPLVQARIVCNRRQYGRLPMDVVSLSFTRGSISVSNLPVRIKSIDYGDLESGRISLEVVQDVFRSGVGSFGDPPGSDWDPPGGDLPPFEADEQIAIEAPRAFVARDSTAASPSTPKVYATARTDGVEAGFRIYARSASGAPSGDFIQVGSSISLALLGELRDALEVGDAVPRASEIVVTATPDSEDALAAAQTVAVTADQAGANLSTICMIGDEFVLPLSIANASDGDGEVELQDVYRGVCDSIQKAHPAGTEVWMIFVGGNTTDQAFEPTHNVDVRLEPAAFNGSGDQTLATTIALAMDRRTQRPYCPADIQLDGTAWDEGPISLEASGIGEADGIPIEFTRRDFDTDNEIASLEADAEVIDGTYPSKNSTTHSAEVIDDPDGAATSLFTIDFGALNSGTLSRLQVLKETGGVVPSRMRLALKSTHDFEGDSLDSRETIEWDFDVSSALSSLFNFGAIDAFAWSNVYTATVSGTYSFTLSSPFSIGNTTYRINGGSSAVLIAAGATSGSIVGVSASDTIEVRHQSSDSGALKLLEMNAPGAGQNGYAILYV